MNPKIVGIAGGAASGKSTLARRLQERLQPGVSIVHLDDFFLIDQSRGPFITSPTDGRQYFDRNHPDAFGLGGIISRLETLGQGNTAAEIILIEGVFSLALKELRQRMHLKVFMWLEDDIRLGRKIVRNYREFGKDPAITLQNYLDSGQPGHERYVARTVKHADLVLYGEKHPDENARVVETLIRNL